MLKKPGIIDSDGAVRDLSGVIDGLGGDVLTDLSSLSSTDVNTLPKVQVRFVSVRVLPVPAN